MDISIDRDGDVPLAVQLSWALRARILSGELESGSRLPGVRELAAATGVNVNTVRAVYARLEAEGLVAAEHGRGTFVSHAAPSDARLGDVARGAFEAAQAAGVDPRELAAALYTGLPAAAPDGDAAERRRLRREIGRLDLALGAARLVRRLGPPDEDAAAAAPTRLRARVPGVAELRAIRDDLAARLQLLAEADALAGEPAAPQAAEQVAAPRARPATSSRTTTAPGLRWTPSFGA